MSTVHKVMQLWRPGQYIKPYDAGPRLGHLFGAGQQGGLYLFDKAHQASAFQGSAYDTPLSAVEQFIGSFYDLSGNANHCAQPTSTARAKWSARVNLIGNSKTTFTSAGTTPPLVNNSATFAGESCTSVKFTPGSSVGYAGSRATGAHSANYQINIPYISGFRVALSRVLVPGELITLYFTGGYGFPPIQLTHVNSVGLVDAPTFMRSAIGVANTVSSVVLPNIFLGNTLLSDLEVYIFDSEFLLSSNAYLPHQRVNTASDYDTAGFPYYLLPDGADDYYTSATGGGSTTGIFICAAIAPMAAGAKQVIWSDASGNTGYELCINSSNQVEFSAGTGSARVSCVSAALTLGAPKVITAQHDGTNLTVRVDGVATTAACGAASAGTAGTTLLRANGAASNYAKVQVNGFIQRHGAQPSAELLTFAERHMANLQGRTL